MPYPTKANFFKLIPYLSERNSPQHMLQKIERNLGDVAILDFFFTQFVLVSKANLVNRYCKDVDAFDKGWSYNPLRSFLGRGMLTSTAEEWRLSRKLLSGLFSHSNLDKSIVAISSVFDSYLSNLSIKSKNNELVNIYNDLQIETVEIVSRALTGVRWSKQQTLALKNAIDAAAIHVDRMYALPINFPVPLPSYRLHRVKQLKTQIYRLLKNVLEGYRPAEDNLGLVSLMKTKSIAEDRIYEELLTMTVAGYKSTAAFISWTLWLLVQYPEWIDKIRNETDSLNLSAMKASGLLSLPLTNAFLNESLRYIPPTWIFGRTCLQDTEVEGYAFRRGQTLMSSTYNLHFNENYWEKPNEFLPTRFLEKGRDRHPAFIPFGSGHRTCIGMSFSKLEGIYFVAKLVREFDIEYAPTHELVKVHSTIVAPKGGMNFRLLPRKSQKTL